MYRPDSASAHRENARYAKLPVQPWSKGMFRPSSMPCLHVALNYANFPSFPEKQMPENLKE